MLASKPVEQTAEKLEVRAPRIDQSFEHKIQIIITSAGFSLLCAGGSVQIKVVWLERVDQGLANRQQCQVLFRTWRIPLLGIL
jgi:hypothetical protein